MTELSFSVQCSGQREVSDVRGQRVSISDFGLRIDRANSRGQRTRLRSSSFAAARRGQMTENRGQRVSISDCRLRIAARRGHRGLRPGGILDLWIRSPRRRRYDPCEPEAPLSLIWKYPSTWFQV